MSVQDAGKVIRDARTKAHLSQEQLSDGICSALSLSRIENGTAGVSPATFQALMARAGVHQEAFPVFAGRTDFDCFHTLKRAGFYLDTWQLSSAFAELEAVEQMNFANNRFHYQEWLMLQCRLQLRSGSHDYRRIYETATAALELSLSELPDEGLPEQQLSVNELWLLLIRAEVDLYLGNIKGSTTFSQKLGDYLEKSTFSLKTEDNLTAANAVLLCKCLFAASRYPEALALSDAIRHRMAVHMRDTFLYELTFLTALGHYYTGNTKQALSFFQTAFFASHAIGSCFATICRNYVLKHWDLALSKRLLAVPDIQIPVFQYKEITDNTFGNGICDLSVFDLYQLGDLIRDFRTEQHISQQILCQGLCSKSMLSKIENNTLMPNILLAQALLQRLGVSDSDFTFYGNQHEARLHELQTKIDHHSNLDEAFLQQNLKEMEELLTPKDSLSRQYLLFKRACREADPSAKLSGLTEALSVTLPDFRMTRILESRLTDMELSILNQFCSAYADSQSLSTGISYFYKILEYLNESNYDVQIQGNIYTATLAMLSQRLYRAKRYSELVELLPAAHSSMTRCDTYFFSIALAHICQALGECGHLDKVYLPASYSYYSLSLVEFHDTAKLIRQFIEEDFRIRID